MADDRRPGSINFVAPYKGGMISGWPTGMDNRSSDADIPRSSLRDIVNCDVLTSGKMRMRRGMRRVINDPNAHSVYGAQNYIVWATPTTLCIASTNLTKIVLATNPLYALPISYTQVNGEVYFSNENINGKITADGVLVAWGIKPPALAPIIATSSGPRVIQITCTFINAAGEESGAPLGYMVTCLDDPYLAVSAIPQSSDPRVTATRLYLSEIGGADFFQAADVPVGTTTYKFNGTPSKGQILRTQFMSPPPPGQLISYQNGLLFIAVGKNVVHTEPFNYGLYDPEAAFFMFAERVTLCHAADKGLYVSADQTYFLPRAGTDEVEQIPSLPYRAYEGASFESLDTLDVYWMSERGLIKGTQNGEMSNLTETQIAVDRHTRGCLGVIETNGHKALIAVMEGRVRNNPLTSSDYLAVRDT